MRSAKIFRQFAHDDRGGEIVEYALIGGLIVIAVLAVVTALGSNVLARWVPVDGGH